MPKTVQGKRSVLFAIIDESQHEALRYIAYKERRSIADVTREAIQRYIEAKSAEYPVKELIPSGEDLLSEQK